MTEIDLRAHGPEFIRNPHPLYTGLRNSAAAHRIRFTEGFDGWLIVGYEDAKAALTDPRLIKDERRAPGIDDVVQPARAVAKHMLSLDPPDHTRLRKLVAREFTARRVAGLRPRVQEITDELLDALTKAPEGRVDLVEALSFPLPITVIAELLGVPFLARETFREISSGLLESTGPEVERAAAERMHGFLEELVAEKRQAGGADLLSALLDVGSEGTEAALTDAELRGMAFLLLVAGYETTVNLISSTVLCLLQHPEQLAEVRADPSLVDAAVEETLRFEGPVERTTLRFSIEPVEFADGTVIPAGEVVCVSLASASRDPERYPNPDTFDIHRESNSHLGFGHGLHFCLGAPLARLEATIAVRTLLDRVPALALPAADVPWRPGTLLRGPSELPVRVA